MPPIRLTLVILLLLISAGSAAADGSIHLYLQPLPSEASRLTFAIDALAAVAESGSEHPLSLHLSTVRLREAGRQRLLASGRLPPGNYAGFVLRVTQATLGNDQGEAALLVPDTVVRLDVPFVVSGGQTPLFWLTLRYRESLVDGVRFSPAFSAVAPALPIADNAGFVTNLASNTITVFDKRLSQAVAVIDTCAGPAGMALDQRRRRLYVACSKDAEIQAFDIATARQVDRSRLSPGDRPRELALTPDGRTLLSVNTGSNTVSFFDAGSLRGEERIAVGRGPGAILIDPAGTRAFVFNTLSSTLSVVDLLNRNLVATVSTEASPLRGQFGGRGDRIFVIHERSPYMTVLDPKQLTTIARARLRTAVTAVAFDPVRSLLCLAGTQGGPIEFYDPNALMPLYALKTSSGISHLAVDVEHSRLCMVSPRTRSLVVARLGDRRLDAEIDVGDGPYWVAVMGER